ncbi:MAG: hypothetical protein ACJAWW_000065 [Sulfurimonas sp.]|jgi:hypothetical protein
MNPVIDGIMLVLFIIFMVFIFGGYHKNKSGQREAQFKREKEEQDKLNSKV